MKFLPLLFVFHVYLKNSLYPERALLSESLPSQVNLTSSDAMAKEKKRTKINGAAELAISLNKTPNELSKFGIKINKDGIRRNVLDVLGYPDVDLALVVKIWPEMAGLSEPVAEQIEIMGHYSGYMDRQEADIQAFRKDESLLIPDDIDFDKVGGLSNEIKTKFYYGFF